MVNRGAFSSWRRQCSIAACDGLAINSERPRYSAVADSRLLRLICVRRAGRVVWRQQWDLEDTWASQTSIH